MSVAPACRAPGGQEITSAPPSSYRLRLVARDYQVSRYWVQQLVKRFEAEGEAAYQPRTNRPHSNPRAVGIELKDQIIRLRKELLKQGLDAGAETIRVHLTRDPGQDRIPSISTI